MLRSSARRRCVVSPPLIYVKRALIIVHIIKEVGKSGDDEKIATAVEDEGDDSDSGSSDGEDLLTAMAAVRIEESPWKNAPTFPSLYLSTVAEYLPPQPKARLPKGVTVDDLGDEDKDVSWAKETYEDSLEVDQVFERFMKRVGYEGEQCVRLVYYVLFSSANSHDMKPDMSSVGHHYHMLRIRRSTCSGLCRAKIHCQ